MRVADLMTRDVIGIDRDATVAEAIGRLADEHVGAIAVVTGRNRLVGVISTADVLRAEADTTDTDARDILFEQTRVAELMTARALTIAPGVEAREAARQMLYADVHRLFVEDAGELVGVISQSDLVRALALGKV